MRCAVPRSKCWDSSLIRNCAARSSLQQSVKEMIKIQNTYITAQYSTNKSNELQHRIQILPAYVRQVARL
jgi:uncharacterized FlgJ-related protein